MLQKTELLVYTLWGSLDIHFSMAALVAAPGRWLRAGCAALSASQA